MLLTGLGLGCAVRGLLANQRVERVTVIEADAEIVRAVPDVQRDPRVRVVHADASAWRPAPGERFDFAWHDICEDGCGGPALQLLHARLLLRYQGACRWQGAWGMPRWFWRGMGLPRPGALRCGRRRRGGSGDLR